MLFKKIGPDGEPLLDGAHPIPGTRYVLEVETEHEGPRIHTVMLFMAKAFPPTWKPKNPPDPWPLPDNEALSRTDDDPMGLSSEDSEADEGEVGTNPYGPYASRRNDLATKSGHRS